MKGDSAVNCGVLFWGRGWEGNCKCTEKLQKSFKHSSPICVCVCVCTQTFLNLFMFYMLFELFESKLQVSCPFISKCFKVCFLKILSYIAVVEL